ncbi:hypothetical protein XM47_01095 [Catenovulum maritimum]|uniref:TniQ domain-containing protein n=2 Tax=Catenovulum maritimum TaxID=1513271 RepID=A0A0J8JPY2_9ALTE|nr:hypothetical protein XM47_01095 [Catenovulum maritimum]
MRLAQDNGYIKASSFWSAIRRTLDKPELRYLNIPNKLEKINPYLANHSSGLRVKALTYLSKLTNQESLPLISLSIFRSPSHYCGKNTAIIRNGMTLPRMFVKTEPGVCPECLKESNYIRQTWAFWPYNTCHKHKIKLIENCCCGEIISAFSDHKLGVCQCCGHEYKNLEGVKENHNDFELSHWLAGTHKNLPNVKDSHKFGLILWWLKLHQLTLAEFESEVFINFFTEWPSSFQKYLKNQWEHYSEYGLKPISDASFSDVFGKLLSNSAKLPSARLSENIVLTEIYKYFDDNLISENNEFLKLKINSIEAALLLNTSTEQIAALVEQGELSSGIRIKSGGFLNINQPAFELGDLYCLWQAGYQTEYSNFSIITSRW